VKTSIISLEELAANHQILLLQEHWLFNFEKHLLNSILENFNAAAKSVDDDDPIPPIQKPRGYGGVAVLWHKKLDKQVQVIDSGNSRIQAILLKAKPRDTLIICCYMPSAGTRESDVLYEETTALINAIIQQHDANVLLAGDINADITNPQPTRRKETLSRMLAQNGLSRPPEDTGALTFVHPNGVDCSCIDYFFIDKPIANHILKFQTLSDLPSNTSDHYPVSLTISSQVRVDSGIGKPGTPSSTSTTMHKVNWEKIDLPKYQTRIEDALRAKVYRKAFEGPNALDTGLDQVITLMKTAAQEAAPQKKAVKKKRTTYSEEVKRALINCRTALWKWKSAGKPRTSTHPTVLLKKESKKKLRSQLRLEEALRRRDKIQKIAETANSKDNRFFKLVKKETQGKAEVTKEIVVDGKLLSTTEEICKGWADHFGDLATPKDTADFDRAYSEEISCDLTVIQELISMEQDNPEPISVEEVQKAINSLNTKKAPDVDGITAEHLKNGGILLTAALTQLVNTIMSQRRVPARLKLGLLTPIWKKKKDKTVPANYRGITVISVVGKVIEKLLKKKIAPAIEAKQNPLQRGFTKGTPPLNAALLMQEAINQAKQEKRTLFMAFLDAKAAFDVVDQTSLMRKLYLTGITGATWSITLDMFHEAKTTVKWQGTTSEPFTIHQGVRQGGILSTDQYKCYNNDLLDRLIESHYGVRIGDIPCNAPTCADDVALLAHSRTDLQAMLDMCYSYSRMERFYLQPTKSMILILNDKDAQEPQFHLGPDPIPVVTEALHLGILRDKETGGCLGTLKNNITKARGALYAQMGTGLHGTNGLPPAICVRVLNTYIMPILLYGLEILLPSPSDIKEAEAFHTRTLKQLLSLPDTCANLVVYILSGHLPLTGQIHLKALTLLGSILRDKTSLEYQLIERQFTMGFPNKFSWCTRVRKILIQYDLPQMTQLLEEPLTKKEWNKMVKKACNTYWYREISEMAALYPSLKYLNGRLYNPGSCHPAVTSVTESQADIKRFPLSQRFLTGTVTLQANRSKFNQFQVEPTCPLCSQSAEDREHVLTECLVYTQERKEALERILPLLRGSEENWDEDFWTSLFIDCSSLVGTGAIIEGKEDLVYFHSRVYISKIMKKRLIELAKLPMNTKDKKN
jgi:hypothetical protein